MKFSKEFGLTNIAMESDTSSVISKHLNPQSDESSYSSIILDDCRVNFIEVSFSHVTTKK